MFGIGLTEVIVIFVIFVISMRFFLLRSSNSQKKTISKILSNKKIEMAVSYCTKCGKAVLGGSFFCNHCGANLSSGKSSIHNPSVSSVLTDDDFATFVGKNSEKYLRKFAKFSIGGIDSFKATWHWPAFFVPFWWMLYRKIYGWAILALVTVWIPFLPVVWAITANYIYYRQTKKKLLEIKQLHPSPETQRAVIAVTGGVEYAVLLTILISLAIIGILAAIAIPQFETYRQRAYDAQIRPEIQSAYTMPVLF